MERGTNVTHKAARAVPMILLTCTALLAGGGCATSAHPVVTASPAVSSLTPTPAPTPTATPSVQSLRAAEVASEAYTVERPTLKPTPKPKPSPTARKTTAKPPSAKVDPRCLTGARVMCADKSKGVLYYVKDGEIVRTFAARFGRTGYATAEGQFSVTRKVKDEISRQYNDAPMPYSMYFYGGQAVHYSGDFAANTNPQGSHGCVNIKDRAGIAAVYGEVQVGDKVVVFRSSQLS